jgi:hypothetical protein
MVQANKTTEWISCLLIQCKSFDIEVSKFHNVAQYLK